MSQTKTKKVWIKNAKLDADKFMDEMRKLGWTINEYGVWLFPMGISKLQAERDFRTAILTSLYFDVEDKNDNTNTSG